MDWILIFIGTIVVLFSLLFLGQWIAFALGATGLLGLYVMTGGTKFFETLSTIAWNTTNSFEYTSIPLFILMGEILVHSGLSRYFYDGAAKWFGRLPGGLLQTNIISCSIFAAICGSSPATASAIGSVSYPEMVKQKYNKSMVIGSLAGGGALGILIPPSITMIIYGAIVETSVEKLFMAGLVPGILAAVIFMIYIGVASLVKKDLTPAKTEKLSAREKIKSSLGMLPFLVMIVAVLGGIYTGFTTTAEAAAIGVIMAIIFSFIVKGITWSNFKQSIIATIKLTTMILTIVFCSKVLSYFVVISGISRNLTEWIISINPTIVEFLLVITVLYLILGCLMDGASMMYITIPILLPSIQSLGIDLTWFGVILVILIELSMITPPVGLNLYVLHGVVNNLGSPTEFGEVIKGSIPYCLMYLALVLIVMLFPGLALWLPGMM